MSMLARTTTVQIGALPRVDLLPRSEIMRREARSHARAWVGIGLVVLLVTGGLVGGAGVLQVTAQGALAAENAETQRILAGIAEHAEVSAAVSTRGTLTTFSDDASAGDGSWTAALMMLAYGMPEGTTVTGFSFTSAGESTAGDDVIEAATAAAAEFNTAGLVVPVPGMYTGSITFSSTEPLVLVEISRGLRSSPGVLQAHVQALAEDEESGGYTYVVDVVLDQAIFLAEGGADAWAATEAAATEQAQSTPASVEADVAGDDDADATSGSRAPDADPSADTETEG